MLLSSFIPDDTSPDNLTVINKVKNVQIVSLYIWGSDQSDKGDSWITTNVQPDSSVSFSLPSGKCNILAFDELGNSYEIKGSFKKNTPDTLDIDLEYLTFSTPNIDYGDYPLNLFNSLSGFAVDIVILSSPDPEPDIVIDNLRVFPGNSITVWLDKGNYSITAVDQIDRTYHIERVSVPCDSGSVSILDSMICNPVVPIGITGRGSGALIIENCLPWTAINELRIPPDDDFEGIHLDDLSLQPGAGIVIELDPGLYPLTVSDEHDGKYSLLVEVTDANTTRIPLTSDFLDFNFSFPERQDQ